MNYYILWISPYVQAVGYYGNIDDALKFFRTKSLVSDYIAYETDVFLLNNTYIQELGEHRYDSKIKIWRSVDSNDLRCCSASSIESAAYILDLEEDKVKAINVRRVNLGV